MIITIAGDIGAGKSTVAAILAKELGYHQHSNGNFMRQMAENRGITLLALSEIAKTDPSIDREIDERQIELGKTEDNFVIDARIGFHFIPQSFKVRLSVNPQEGARRVYESRRQKEVENSSFEKTLESNLRRQSSELHRYKTLYNVDPTDRRHYDIVVDTTNIHAIEVARLILEKVRERLQKHMKNCPPKSLNNTEGSPDYPSKGE